MTEPRRFVTAILSGLVLGSTSLGCAGRLRVDDMTASKAAWTPARMVDWAACPPKAERYQGPLPSEPNSFAIVASLDARGEIVSTEVVDRWPLPGACDDDVPWERRSLDRFFADFVFEPARREGRGVAGTWVQVQSTGQTPTEEPERARVAARCDVTRAELTPASLEDAERHLVDLALWEGYRVGVLLDVDATGRVGAARILTRHPTTLDPAEEPWASMLLDWIDDEWSFAPATRDGVPVPARAWLNVHVSPGVRGPRVHADTIEETLRSREE